MLIYAIIHWLIVPYGASNNSTYLNGTYYIKETMTYFDIFVVRKYYLF